MGTLDLTKLIHLYKVESQVAFSSIPTEDIQRFYQVILESFNHNGTILACGNGGNVGLISNIVADLNLHPFVADDKSDKGSKNRGGFKAISLCEETSTITAIMNDMGSEYVYSKQIEYLAPILPSKDSIIRPVLLAISGSGTSKNILKAVEAAKALSMPVLAITRTRGSALMTMADHTICIDGESNFPGQTGPNNNNFHMEDCICKIFHLITGLLRKEVEDNNV